MKFESDGLEIGIVNSFERQQRRFVMNVFIVIYIYLQSFCPYLLHLPCYAEPISVLLYVSYTFWCVEANILHTGERHLCLKTVLRPVSTPVAK